VINSALRPLHELVDAPKAVQLALSAAETVDRKVAQIGDELKSTILTSGHERALRRSLHRNEHLDEIKRAVRP